MENQVFVIAALMVLALMFLMMMFAKLFRKAGPHEAIIVYGFRGTRVVKGRGTVIFPMVQVVRSLVHRGAIDMTVAYRYFGFPLAALGGIGALVIFSVIETRTAGRLLATR